MIVVTGATGNIGRPLVAELVRRGHDVTAVSRAGSAPFDSPLVRGVSADLAEPEGLRAAVDGADALFLLVPGSGGHLDTERIIGIAAEAGVRRLVLLSSLGAVTRAGSASHGPLAELEKRVQGSGLEWTLLRPADFASNALAWVPTVRSERAVHAPFGDVALPAVNPLDIAEVAAAALADDGHAGRAYVLTGPAAVSPRERTEVLARALGVPIAFVEQTRDEARADMLAYMPEPVVDGTLGILGEPTPQEQRVSLDIEKVLGRPARTFGDWARRNVAAFGG
ncbi:NAD(P)H-binding protein [Promicromonospora sp. MEB111]|uniref:NAD(P)H-binding protein n=1 Tax=Promicromonospora sp. MEB111 TaxID=3040301 RepID=UPI00254AC668|nr:NAD(P)H-binding protein [Promicromonospora sp. MEB111]